MENWGRKALMAVAVFGTVNTGETAQAQGAVTGPYEARERIEEAMAEACGDVADVSRRYSGAELSDRLVDIDSDLRRAIRRETILWQRTRDNYEARVEPLIRGCHAVDSRRYDDLGGPATPRKN